MGRLKLPFLTFACLLLACISMAGPKSASAADACAKVSIEILQELTIERTAFDAKLVVTNNLTGTTLQNIRVDLVIRDAAGNLKDTLFFARKPDVSGTSGLDGTGSVGPRSKVEAHWLIIPSPGAGFIEENGAVKQIGVDYWVGATMTYTMDGKQETLQINPGRITVKPMPQLVLDYFMPSSVLGDNPFTPQVEAPVPYPLAVRVMNDGYGPASKLKIDSAQPKIVKENNQQLLISFLILGASVNDSPVSPSLSVNFGDLGSKKGATAYWQMISTLSGRFIDFKTTFSHAAELGGELTSLLRETNPHYLTHMVKVNLPGRDGLLDFLADVNEATGSAAIYESEMPNGSTKLSDARSPVAITPPIGTPARPTTESPKVNLTVAAGPVGWIYTKLPDPSQGMLKLLDVTRADGVRLDTHNFWVDQGYDKDFKKTWTLQLVDYRMDSNTPNMYILTYTKPDVDTTPPTSTLVFDGPNKGTEPVYISPTTRIIVTATDNDGGSGVDAMYRKVSGIDNEFIPALPFNLAQPGTYTVQYYSVDRSGNVETTRSTTIIVAASGPEIGEFTATPSIIMPRAPKGVSAARKVNFSLTATGSTGAIPATIEIASGSPFKQENVVKTLTATANSGTATNFVWDATGISGGIVPSGTYTVKASVSDGMAGDSGVATKEVTVIVKDWFDAQPVDPNPAADQMHPRISGTRVVWQDMRNGNWDIYTREIGGAPSQKIAGDASDQQRPSIDGKIIVWQDARNGKSDIYGYDLDAKSEFRVCTTTDCSEPGNKERPVVSGDWVVWQDNRGGNWDIYAQKLSTKETITITSHERDQIMPAISGTTVVWEDYRNGTADIYRYDLTTRQEYRITVDPENQTLPSVSGNTVAWTDQRDGHKEIYTYDPAKGTLRITYGATDSSEAAVSGNLLVYTGYEAGLEDPNIFFSLLTGGAGGVLTSNSARQEEPALGTGVVVWQDNRDGKYQIYMAPLQTEPLPIEVELKQGFNLVAAGDSLVSQYPNASSLLAAENGQLIERVLVLDRLHNTYSDYSGSGADFNLVKGTAIALYARKAATLKVGDSGETASYSLVPGANQIGILSVPYGYGAYDLMRSVGLDNIQSVRRFNSSTGAWQTVTVRTTVNGNEPVGVNFPIQPGDGLSITMKKRVDGWTP